MTIFLCFKDAFDVRFKNAERAELSALVHHGLNGCQSFELFNGESIDRLDEIVLGNVCETVLAVLPKTAVFTEDSGVDKALQDAVGEASVAHIIESGQHVHLLQVFEV